MSKLKHEAELLKEALRVGMIYAEKRGAAKFEATDSASEKVEFVYRLLVHDKLITLILQFIKVACLGCSSLLDLLDNFQCNPTVSF